MDFRAEDKPTRTLVARDAPMRRGLRHVVNARQLLLDIGRARRPDEKGIETEINATVVAKRQSRARRPDEKGIETLTSEIAPIMSQDISVARDAPMRRGLRHRFRLAGMWERTPAVARDAPMRRGLRLVAIVFFLASLLLGRARRPDEKGIETFHVNYVAPT